MLLLLLDAAGRNNAQSSGFQYSEADASGSASEGTTTFQLSFTSATSTYQTTGQQNERRTTSADMEQHGHTTSGSMSGGGTGFLRGDVSQFSLCFLRMSLLLFLLSPPALKGEWIAVAICSPDLVGFLCLVALYRAIPLRFGYGLKSCDANGPRAKRYGETCH